MGVERNEAGRWVKSLEATEGSRLAPGSSGQLPTASSRAQAGSGDASLQLRSGSGSWGCGLCVVPPFFGQDPLQAGHSAGIQPWKLQVLARGHFKGSDLSYGVRQTLLQEMTSLDWKEKRAPGCPRQDNPLTRQHCPQHAPSPPVLLQRCACHSTLPLRCPTHMRTGDNPGDGPESAGPGAAPSTAS